MSDHLIEALLSEQAEQPATPEYVVGSSTYGSVRFLAVNRVATNEEPGGMEVARALTGRRYMVTFPHETTRWVVATLGAYLTDEEWDEVCEEREYEIDRRDRERPA